VTGVLGPEPLLGQPWIGDVGADLGCVQVAEVGGDPAAKLGVVADVAVAGHDHPHALGPRQQSQAPPVAAERVGRLGVEQRDLDVGAHVAGDQHSDLGQEDGAVTGGVRVVREHDRARPGPVDLAAEQRLEAGEQREVVAGARLGDAADQPGQFPGGGRDRARRRVPGHVAERGRPEQVIPVRMGRPSRHRAQAALRQPAREPGQVGDGHRRVDEQAAAVGADHDRGRRGVPVSRRDVDAGGDLIHASRRYRTAPRRGG
jgi:hypothetical protein